MEELEEIKKEVELIKERNRKVELDKAWETSASRITFIVLVTYIATAVVFYFIGVSNYLRNALIPTIGYYLSAQSLPFIKKFWAKKLYKKRT